MINFELAVTVALSGIISVFVVLAILQVSVKTVGWLVNRAGKTAGKSQGL